MTPSNPDNQQPLIYRIADAAGVFHLVAPVNHMHTYQDVPGLAGELNELWAGLNEKANSEDVTEALAGKMNTMTIDSTPTADSQNLVTSGGVAAALAAKMYNKTIDSTPTAYSPNLVTSGGVKTALLGKADKNHTHTPTEVQGVIPSFVEWTGQTLDLDAIIDGTLGMVRLMIYNNDSNDTTFGDLFESLESLPIHLNANAATAIETQHYALCTIYKMDKSQTPSEHDHDLCYFITLDGVFNDGNPSV